MNRLALATAGVSLALLGPVLPSDRVEGPDRGLLTDWTATPASVHALPPSASLDDPNALVEEYCTRCHSERRRRGDLVLEGFDVASAQENGATVEKMIRKLRAGMMPPSGANRPEELVIQGLAADLETVMDGAAADDPRPGRRTFQRLNRAEYAAAVDDLLGVDVDVSSFLPLDTKSANFDNIADVQMPSATVMEGYLRAAGHISRLALGDPDAEIGSTIYRVPRITSQKDQVDGAPIGTRGGISVVHNFPADGKYVFHIMPYGAVEGEVFGRTFGTEQVEVSIDGAPVALMTVDRWMHESEPTGLNIRTDSIYVRAGPRRVSVAYVRQFEGVLDDLIRPIDHTMADGQMGIGYGVTTLQHLQRVTVLGPFGVTGISDNPVRQRVFTCRPTAPDEERPCARDIIDRLATQAYRRPLGDSDLDGLLGFYDTGAAEGGFEQGIRTALQAILASPHFLFRMERGTPAAEAGESYRVADLDLASRLSFFLWGSVPDQELIDAASEGRLASAAGLREQAQRLLDDPRAAEALAHRFAAQWLRLQDLEKVHPDALTYPYYDETLAQAMHEETEVFFEHLVSEDRPVFDLLTADYTFVNERLARHYGMPGITGNEFQRVQYASESRRGILGHGSILTLTSHPDRTSPVLRGKWVLEVLLGSPPPPPPPDVPPFEETDASEGDRFRTVRERMEQHRANPTCNSCHRVIDPVGLALENFDVTGAWRNKDEGNPVDPVGMLYDGTEVSSPEDLRAALLERSEVFVQVFTENLMAYALGRRVEFYDMPTVRAIARAAADNDYRVSSFVMGIVDSPAFRMAEAGTVAEDQQPAGSP